MATKSRLRVSAPALAVMSAAAALYPLRLPAGHMMSARAPRAIARRARTRRGGYAQEEEEATRLSLQLFRMFHRPRDIIAAVVVKS